MCCKACTKVPLGALRCAGKAEVECLQKVRQHCSC